MSDSWLNRCFKVECSHGDSRPSWFIYRRVIAETSQVVECVRIEARGDGSHVLYLADPIMKSALQAQTEIPREEFRLATVNLTRAVATLFGESHE